MAAIQAQLVTDQITFGFSPHDSIMETGAGFLNIPRQQQLMMMQFDPFQSLLNQQQSITTQTSFLPKTTVKDQQSVLFPHPLSSQIEKQTMEIDRFITLQNERLRQALQEQRKSQISRMMKKYESKIQCLLKHKDEEILKATNRRMELENLLKRMEMENQTWQMAAKEKEAMAASLNSKIQSLREAACLSINAAEDAESCFGSEEENEEQNTRKMICRCCGSRKACVIMLPCRHLCSCKDCEAFLDSCPVCKMVKKASLEANLTF